MARTARPRSLWLTVPLHVLLLVVAAVNVWAGAFWARVGGSLGSAVGLAAAAVTVVLVALLLVDGRRQWRLRSARQAAEAAGRRRSPSSGEVTPVG